ncbi:hypothetical protein BC477_09930 [Clavibacter michiganensis subsp. michiganensis]|uniref:Uncharacterized protein n=1 Tax=Clavibacter michiganensis subsp. michiganensis TaxID=33013 RepID=A0A251XNK3_CLAMM|nr:hypothetical protein BC477_09930 [Clavibacter michiganensis subsp. michiganensis]OUE05045.1 hypothetical protein CMMCAS07_08850 [Clavibacter michiganensis subsp. michiganensis]
MSGWTNVVLFAVPPWNRVTWAWSDQPAAGVPRSWRSQRS